MYNIALKVLADNLNFFLLMAVSASAITTLSYLVLSKSGKWDEANLFFSIFLVLAFLFGLIVGGYFLNTKNVFPPPLTKSGLLFNASYVVLLVILCATTYLLKNRINRYLSACANIFIKLNLSSLAIIAVFIIVNASLSFLKNTNGKGSPSILLISLDTLRWDHLGCYGYESPTSPNIDALANDAVLFKNAISQSSWTLPTHMSLFTSQYPYEHGAVKAMVSIDTKERGPLLSEVLKDRFYTNAGYTGGALLDQQYGFSDGFDIYSVNYSEYRNPIDDKVLEFLKENRDVHFFLFLHTYCIHNYYAPHEFREIFDTSCDEQMHEWNEILPFVKKFQVSAIDSSGEENKIQHLVKLYDSSIRYVDSRVGFLLQQLKEMDLYDDIMIIITSDHGEEFGDHGHTSHGHTLYDELIRIPLIIKFPNNEYGGTEVRGIVRQIDIVPTVIDYLGIDKMPWMRGQSLLKMIEGRSAKNRQAFSDVENRKKLKFSLRTADYHLVYYVNLKDFIEKKIGSFHLYDVVNDPGELIDISSMDEKIFSELRSDLLDWLSQMDVRKFFKSGKIDLKPDLEKRLKALGYLQ